MNLQDRVNSVNAELPEGYHIALVRPAPEIVMTFAVPGMPDVEGATRYLAINYISGPKMPGVAKFDTTGEAFDFLDKFEEADVDYEKVLEFGRMVHEQGWQDTIYIYVGEWVDKLPAEADGKPHWMEMSDLDDAELVTTIDASTLYGSHGDIARPKDENAILVRILADDIGGESCIEMAYPLEALGIEEGSLEEFLAFQLVCNDGRFAFVRRDLIGAIWLTAVPENLECLEIAVESEDFKRYYDGHSPSSECKEAIQDWIKATAREISVWHYTDEELDEFDALFGEWKKRLVGENYV